MFPSPSPPHLPPSDQLSAPNPPEFLSLDSAAERLLTVNPLNVQPVLSSGPQNSCRDSTINPSDNDAPCDNNDPAIGHNDSLKSGEDSPHVNGVDAPPNDAMDTCDQGARSEEAGHKKDDFTMDEEEDRDTLNPETPRHADTALAQEMSISQEFQDNREVHAPMDQEENESNLNDTAPGKEDDHNVHAPMDQDRDDVNSDDDALGEDDIPKEDISLKPGFTPKVPSDTEYLIYGADGAAIPVAPSFHHQLYHERFRQVMQRIQRFYYNKLPLHVIQPKLLIIAIYTYDNWMKLEPLRRQLVIARQNVVVRGWPRAEKLEFDQPGLRKVAGTNGQQISIQDYSIAPEDDFLTGVTVSGRVGDLWQNCGYNGKILNALDLPMHDGNTEAQEYTSDLHAWALTRGQHNVHNCSPYPTEHMRWALVGLKDSITFFHADCDGFSTYLNVLCGGKFWVFLRKQPENPLSSPNFFLDKGFHLERVLEDSKYDAEGIALQPGDRLYMLPNQPHLVYTYKNSMCHGGHYYFTCNMHKTLCGLIHTFMLHKFLTNTSHPSRGLLWRMVLFYHIGFLGKEFDSNDPAHSHLPEITVMPGLLNFVSACVLVILGNVLNLQTYQLPNQDEDTDGLHQTLTECDINAIPVNERLANCYARGVALYLFIRKTIF